MAGHVRVVVVGLLAIATLDVGAGGQPIPPGLVGADRHDVSPALRNLPPQPPRRGPFREMPRFRRAAPNRRSRDPIVQNFSTAPLVPAPSLSFDGVANINGVLPPDTNGDVGPNHFVQWVNLSFAIYGKGSPTVAPALLYGPAGGNTLWAGFGGPCETANSGDPVVRYDHLADRWLMSQLAIPNSFLGLLFAPFYQCIAVSATPDPTGPYYRYQFSFNKLNDYPKFGVWPDAYYMTMNQFLPLSLQWGGQGVVAFDRASMLAGQAAAMVYFDLATVDLNLGGMLPSDLDGPPPPAGSPNYFVQVDDDAWGYSPDQLQLWRFHVDWTTPSASSFTHTVSLPTAPFDSSLCGTAETCIPQPGTTAKLDALSDRLMYRLQYRNFGDHESLVVNHTVDVDGTDHAGIRWYELRDPQTAPSIYQQSTYAPDGDHRWMGSAAMDGAGNLAVGFSLSGPATFPSVRYAARLATDPIGTLAQGETDLVVGSGSQTHTSGRWGDYSMLVVDPSDDCTFWYTQEYYAATSSAGWRTRIGTFSLPSCAPPTSDLPKATVVATTETAKEAGTINGVFTVTRTGDTSSPMTISYTTAGTAVASSDYVPLSGSVTIPAGSSTATIPVVPIDDTLVEPNESVILTLSPDPTYVVGSPGTAFVTIVSDDVPPDLVVTAVAAPAAAGPNAVISVTDTTKNQGSGPADASVTGFYLSKNILLDSSDVPIGTRPVEALTPGASSSGTVSVTIPAGTSTGTYYIIAKADANDAVVETQETNNTKWSNAIGIGPDLIVAALTTPATAAAGATIAVGDTTANQGGQTAAASTTSFYLSANVSLDAGDVLLGSRAVPALDANGSSAMTTLLTIPAGTAAGLYYILAQADSAGVVVETQETNNVKFSASTRIGADLIVSSITAPSSAGAGAVMVVSDTTKNQGAGAAAASTTGFYLSTNATLDTTDMFLGSRPVAALGGGASATASTTLTMPPNVATGSYYVIARADNNNEIAESNESNNTGLSLPVRVGPDLTVTTTTAPAIAGAGGSIIVGDTTKNAGGGASPASTTGFYLSTSSTLSSSAILIGSRPVPVLGAGATDVASTSVTMPPNLATGTYYVLASADYNNQVVETVESNNAGFGALVRVGPDVTISALTAPSSALTGASMTVSDTISNAGGGSAPPSTTRFYLSTNLAIDAADVAVGFRSVGALNAGQADSGSSTIAIPAELAPGSYWLIAAADGDGVIPETSETNNTRATLIQIARGS